MGEPGLARTVVWLLRWRESVVWLMMCVGVCACVAVCGDTAGALDGWISGWWIAMGVDDGTTCVVWWVDVWCSRYVS
jgi:hypothetical protein